MSAVRLERTRDELKRPVFQALGAEAAKEARKAAALAEVERAEVVISAARRVLDAVGFPEQNVARENLRSALAAFGSGEGDGA